MRNMSTEAPNTFSVSHPRELHATFFLPTIDYIPIDASVQFPGWVCLDTPVAISRIKDRTRELVAEKFPTTGDRSPLEDICPADYSTGDLDYSRLYYLASVVRFAAREGESRDDAARIQSFRTATALIGGHPNKKLRREGQSDLKLLTGSKSKTSGTLGSGNSTVAVCTIPLRLLGTFSQARTGILAHPDYFNERVYQNSFSPLDLSTWDYVDLTEVHINSDADEIASFGYVADRLVWAMHIAMSEILAIESSVQMRTRHPLEPTTVERLPSAVAVIVHDRLELSQSSFARSLSINTQQLHHAPLLIDSLDDEEIRHVYYGLRRREDGLFMSHNDLYRDALVAHYRSGNYRDAVLLYAISLESLIDELIMHLHWEEGLTPEASAARVNERESIIKRVARELSRIGGQWSVAVDGPIKEWHEKIVLPRNRVVHASYRPTLQEAHEAREAHDALLVLLCDQLASSAAVKKYPLTSILMVGEGGFERRGFKARRVERIYESIPELTTVERFNNWQAVRSRVLGDRTAKRTPLLGLLELYRITYASSDVGWAVRCPESDLAAHLPKDLLPTNLDARSEYGLRGRIDLTGISNLDVELIQASFAIEDPDLDWQESYRIIPGFGVMFGGNDPANSAN